MRNDEEFPRKTAQEIPVADVHAPALEGNLTVTQTYEVRQSKEERADFIVNIRASVLKRCRSRLMEIGKPGFNWGEAILALATLSGGASIGALLNGMKFTDTYGVFVYTILPVIAIGCLVAHFFMRKNKMRDVKEISKNILEEIPDPDQCEVVKKEGEREGI